LMLVAVVIFWPASVTYWLDKAQALNADEVKIEMKIEDTGADAVPVPAPDAVDEADPSKAVRDALEGAARAASAP
jgi:hypothetical protein